MNLMKSNSTEEEKRILNILKKNLSMHEKRKTVLQQADDFSKDELTRIFWRTQQNLIECFWKKLDEYIPTLLIRPKWNDQLENFKICDIVYMKDWEERTEKWPLGIITNIDIF